MLTANEWHVFCFLKRCYLMWVLGSCEGSWNRTPVDKKAPPVYTIQKTYHLTCGIHALDEWGHRSITRGEWWKCRDSAFHPLPPKTLLSANCNSTRIDEPQLHIKQLFANSTEVQHFFEFHEAFIHSWSSGSEFHRSTVTFWKKAHLVAKKIFCHNSTSLREAFCCKQKGPYLNVGVHGSWGYEASKRMEIQAADVCFMAH